MTPMDMDMCITFFSGMYYSYIGVPIDQLPIDCVSNRFFDHLMSIYAINSKVGLVYGLSEVVTK